MKKFVTSLLIAICGGLLNAQPITDIGLFSNVTSDTLEVRLRPVGNFASLVSSVVFAVRWPAASSASLGPPILTCPDGISITPAGTVSVDGGYQYQAYLALTTSLLSEAGCPWFAGQEYVVMKIPVMDNSGIMHFQIVNDTWTVAQNSDFYISLNASDKTGIIYSNVYPGAGYGVLQGWHYYNEDDDCSFGAGDLGIPYKVMQLFPGPIDMITGSDGFYDAIAPTGDYTLDQAPAPGTYPACPPTVVVPVTIDESVFTTLHIANTADDIVDLQVQVVPDIPRIGYSYPVHLSVRNLGYQTSGPVTISFTFDSQFEHTYSLPAVDFEAGNTLQWDLDPIAAFQSALITVHLDVPPDPALIGAVVDHSASITADLDSDPTNNIEAVLETVVGSIDPNDKAARTSTGASPDQFFIDLDQWITYRIRFQNTGNASASKVVVTDTLDGSLDMSSFAQGPASHSFNVRFLPDRVVQWTFEGIDLPDSTSNELGSHGLVSYRIRPVQPLLPGTVIPNTANIFFDFNPAVITEPSVLVAESSTGLIEPQADGLAVFPVPTTGVLHVQTGPGPLHIAIHSIDGRLLEQRSWTAETDQLDVSGYPAGLYHVSVKYRDGYERAVRFVR